MSPPATRPKRMPRKRQARRAPITRPRVSGGASSAVSGMMSWAKPAVMPTTRLAAARVASEGAAAMASRAAINAASSPRIRRRLSKRSPSGTRKMVPARKPPQVSVATHPAAAASALNSAVQPVLSLAKKERPALLATLEELVSIETGSRDLEGLDRAAELIAARLRALGGKLELVDPSADAYRMEDTPARIGKIVHARFEGKGTKKILLLAHMDTVYLRGMLAKQPFRIDGNRAYGLGISDEKQGVALILHTIAMLKAMDFRGYGLVTVLVNADEEMSSPGSRHLLTPLGAEHDAWFSCESSRIHSDKLALATSGIAAVILNA